MTACERWGSDPQVAVAEDFDDEVIVMNPTSGSFYILRGRAADVWRACIGGHSVASVSTAVAALDASEAEVIDGMLAHFQDTGILAVAVSEGVDGDIALGEAGAEFTRHDDFNDLVRLDPIHDVDESGWPFKK